MNNLDYYNKKEYVDFMWAYAKLDYNERVKLIKKFIDLDKIKNIVELGCGGGGVSDIHEGYIGLDFSKEAIKDVKGSMLCDLNKGVPLDTESVDAIISFNILEHIYPENALKDCVRVIKPKGKLIFREGFNSKSALAQIIMLRLKALLMHFFSSRLIYKKIKPDYSKINDEDPDACAQIDPYAMYLWFRKRGFKCLNKKNILTGLVWKDNFIALEKK